MNSDELVWHVISKQFCSFKTSTDTRKFCRNEYNVTGFCDRMSCPLANSRYATVREHRGRAFLYVKTAERSHTPAKMWERILLPKNLEKADKMIEDELIYWPHFMLRTCKTRLTKITQYLMRMRKIKLKSKTKLVTFNKKAERREASREVKAETAARLDKAIEKELLERLRTKAYGDAPINIRQNVWKQILANEKIEAADDQSDEEYADLEDGVEYENEDEEELDPEADEEFIREFVSDISDSEDDMEDFGEYDFSDEDEDEEEGADDDDDDDGSAPAASTKSGKRKQAPSKRQSTQKPKRRAGRVEIEYERESMGNASARNSW
ncbi:ribosomal L28e protein family-domain-containing protein [Dimargaris cristalligena]|uniref:Protein MAK16 n=1 Tax=Dimargaris cristalligena TaxID=215637 RepID=A0A4Q0A0P4_9FUNG|nr:ribosomal L28e protein family-domain-containing protein [Dimargaris cristalligena]|eukprot:RKP39615.1 ribosomal L28e protein family-domain-containing protein [Dimargaris cristalligena]